LESADELKEEHGIDPEIVDLLSIAPLDTDTIVASVKKTGRCVIVHEAPRRCGPGAEVVARIVENALEYLEAPIQRVTEYDLVLPYFALERSYIPDPKKITMAVKKVVGY
jgi:pyruvate dehydrogenase E1 component beta subunit